MTISEQAIAAMKSARSIVCFSGAGISSESGIATYSEKLTGFWATHDPRHLETAKAFRENPQLVWGWYLWRRQQVSRAQPNAAHLALQRIASLGPTVSIITQNIDDLHERTGSEDVIHLHGSLATPKCFACNRPAEVTPDQPVPEGGSLIEPLRCGRCNGKLRPGVVWYGEDLLPRTWRSALKLVKNCDVLISVGTSGIVTPAANLPGIALSSGATVIHVNIADVGTGEPNEIMLTGKASEILPQLCASLLSERCYP